MTRPRINRDWNKLDDFFRVDLAGFMAEMLTRGYPLFMFEGYRSLDRQQYLHSRGRTIPGKKVTWVDGVRKRSRHQDGEAADIVFLDLNNNPYWPPASDSKWVLFGKLARQHSLVWGGDWRQKDMAHVEKERV